VKEESLAILLASVPLCLTLGCKTYLSLAFTRIGKGLFLLNVLQKSSKRFR
jgi:hypothetical protein